MEWEELIQSMKDLINSTDRIYLMWFRSLKLLIIFHFRPSSTHIPYTNRLFFFYPKQRTMKVLAPQTREQVISKIRELINDTEVIINKSEPSQKRTKLNPFDDDDQLLAALDEVRQYMNCQVGPFEDVSSWWKDHVAHFPKLSVVAPNTYVFRPRAHPQSTTSALQVMLSQKDDVHWALTMSTMFSFWTAS